VGLPRCRRLRLGRRLLLRSFLLVPLPTECHGEDCCRPMRYPSRGRRPGRCPRLAEPLHAVRVDACGPCRGPGYRSTGRGASGASGTAPKPGGRSRTSFGDHAPATRTSSDRRTTKCRLLGPAGSFSP
jgi:hypothetical protein